MMAAVNIIGAGLSGLSAARALAESGLFVRLISTQASERAQSNLAEGGINAALDLMGEGDSVEEHIAETLRGGLDLANIAMAKGLCEAAPGIIADLERWGVPFHRENGRLVARAFGGQKKRRTMYAQSSTGKVIMAALIDEVRWFEAKGLVERFSHHELIDIVIEENGAEKPGDDGNGFQAGAIDSGKRRCVGVRIWDTYAKRPLYFPGPVIVCCGGLSGLFSGMTTGSTANTGQVCARLFEQGVAVGNPEFLQYHPTTVAAAGKRLLISEAARGEGGRLFVQRNGHPYYFMEEKYGERGNLMPRDVVSREMALLDEDAYLDLTGISGKMWNERLADMREELIHYIQIDPKKKPIPVSPGIHFFMGGILVDEAHKTNLPGLYAAGECACGYHGANRLGGNSLLAAIYGGRVAARTVAGESGESTEDFVRKAAEKSRERGGTADPREPAFYGYGDFVGNLIGAPDVPCEQQMQAALNSAMGILRSEKPLSQSLDEIHRLQAKCSSDFERPRLLLAEAMLVAALERKESRGAHTRLDYPETDSEFRKTTVARFDGRKVWITFEEI